jgi:hypothetical protein
MLRSIIAAVAALAGIVSAVYLFVPVARAEQNEVHIGKYRVTADFPCRPKRNSQVVGKAQTGYDLPQTTLVCSQGGVSYSLTATEYPGEVLKSLSADAWASNTLDRLRAQPNYAHKSSARLSYQSFPAIRMHFTDTRTPPLDMARLTILTDAGVVMIGTSWPSKAPEPPAAFVSSLAIAPK